MPNENAEVDARKFDEENGGVVGMYRKFMDVEIGGFGGQEAKLQTVQRINHDGEINRCDWGVL